MKIAKLALPRPAVGDLLPLACYAAATALERVETLANLVAQAAGENGKTEFVPELAAGGPAPAGSRLILAE